MSKQYFAKFLPIEGEITQGDKVQYKTGEVISYDVKLNTDNLKKVALFLCSRDIEKDDVIQFEGHESDDEKLVNVPIKFAKENKGYKVIGEISPEATFVKEGDEFDEENIKSYFSPKQVLKEDWKNYSVLGRDALGKEQIVYPLSHSFGPSSWSIPENPLTHKYQIKGPCGHFH